MLRSFTEEELVPISALQHLLFCKRRAALVHIEGLWAENRFTVEGRHLHERAHDPWQAEVRAGVQITRGLELRSYRLGLLGKADVVEFYPQTDDGPVLVEYKRGRPKPSLDQAFRVQLAAQALCLEEMLACEVTESFLYFGKTRQRFKVPLDKALRDTTHKAIDELHEMIDSRQTPLARYERKCQCCSLLPFCMPKSLRPRATAARYLLQVIADLDSGAEHTEPLP